ncbi:uncharacterized protein ARMOST_19645 [Armillaria ostoyae]|uniref:Uncharacterized protein n=1 Tax=Armillaria ostoyae TaxID=47428 RepID=A0A284S596_ARMOS|nr:uncharacterized protein ARMOST_19645 [Armillaria ostoyae]
MKSSQVPNHEFLLFYAEDLRNIYGREAVIRIERFSDSAPPQPLLEPHVNISAPSLQPLIAVKDYDVLSTLTFNDNSTFSAEEAAMIAMIASDADDEYSVLSHQCYWYARVIYNIILETQVGKYTKTPLEDDKRMGRRGRVKIVNDAASNILIPPSDTSKQLAQTYLAKWHEWQEDIKERIKEKEALLRREEAARRVAEAVAEGERREKLEAQQREEAVLQREESLLRKLQRKDEELARKQKELDDYKRDQVLRMDRASSSRPNAI